MRIQTRVFLTILLSSLVLVAMLFWLMQWSIERGLIDYVNARQRAEFADVATTLQEFYSQDRWQRFRDDPASFDRLMRGRDGRPRTGPPRRQPADDPRRRDGGRTGQPPERARPPPEREGPPPEREGPPPGSPDGITLIGADKSTIAGPSQPFNEATAIPLLVEGKIVGWLLLPRTDRLTRDYDLQFQTSQREALLVIAFVVLGLAGAFAYLLAPSIVKPVKLLAAATNELAHKNYNVLLGATRNDELGELSRDINELAQTLADSEASRQRWLADTSHELRTPVSIIRGEIEAMLDGVRPFEAKNLESLRQEVLRLQQLIDDLADLVNADLGSLRYQKQVLDVGQLLAESESQFEHLCSEAGLVFEMDVPDEAVKIFGDSQRIQQLLLNMIVNAAKYTDAPGRVRLLVARDKDLVSLKIEDSAPAVPDEDIPHIFDHLYRVESSRNRATGGTGLGLAIVQRIVEAHDGDIRAGSSILGGLAITIVFPAVS